MSVHPVYTCTYSHHCKEDNSDCPKQQREASKHDGLGRVAQSELPIPELGEDIVDQIEEEVDEQ